MGVDELLRAYMALLDITGGDLARASGLSHSTISRYCSGTRRPRQMTAQMVSIIDALCAAAEDRHIPGLTGESIRASFSFLPVNRDIYEGFARNMDAVMSDLRLSEKALAAFVGFDISYVSRIRRGRRCPADLDTFAMDTAAFILGTEADSEKKKRLLAQAGCEGLTDPTEVRRCLADLLLKGAYSREDSRRRRMPRNPAL